MKCQEHKRQFAAGRVELDDFTYVYLDEMRRRTEAEADLGHFE